MKVFLIGLPGSGKSTLGRELASRLSMDFVDLDHVIEAREHAIIPEIFKTRGEDYFRRVESEVLSEWAQMDKSFVMSTGGGTPCFYDGMALINTRGVSVFLDESVDVIISRLSANTHRPLLHSDNAADMRAKLEKLRRERLPVYQQASIVVESPTLLKVSEAIMSRWPNL